MSNQWVCVNQLFYCETIKIDDKKSITFVKISCSKGWAGGEEFSEEDGDIWESSYPAVGSWEIALPSSVT